MKRSDYIAPKRTSVHSAPNRSLLNQRSALDFTIRSFPPIVYAWPLIVAGYLLAGYQGMGLAQETASAVYYTILIIVMVTFGLPLSIWQGVFVLALALLGMINVPLVSSVLAFFFYQGGHVDSLFAISVSNALIGLMIVTGIYLNYNYYRVTDTEIVEHHFGRRETATFLVGKQLSAEFPNMFRAILGFGAGDLLVKDTNGERVLLRITDVPGLYFVFSRLENRFRAITRAQREEAGGY